MYAISQFTFNVLFMWNLGTIRGKFLNLIFQKHSVFIGWIFFTNLSTKTNNGDVVVNLA